MLVPIFNVDFNEMVEPDLVLLSAVDNKTDIQGMSVLLYEGMNVCVYTDDVDVDNKVDNLIAAGVVERNLQLGWASHVKWCCRIDKNGIRAESEIEMSVAQYAAKVQSLQADND